MHPRIERRGKLYLLNLFRMGRKVSDVLIAAFKASRLNGGLKRTKQCPPRDVHPEEAFQRLLKNEARRSSRSGHFCQLLLVYRRNTRGALLPMGRRVSKVVIEALSGNLRETDDIGWYRDEHTVGALLTVMGRDSRAGHNRLRWRLEEIFRDRLRSEESSSIRIQVYRHDEITKVDLPGPRDSRMVLL